MLYSICQKLFYKIRQEAVLSVAILLALLSACFVLPDASYFGYIDFRTLAILFSLMTVMAGLQRQGVFTRFACSLLSRTNSITSLVFVLVGLCFFCSMLITNDVALLTFVPFSFAVLGQLPEASGKKLLTPVVCLQTIAANLGSMLTPIGNPQNLYLYGKSQLSFSAFLRLMLPYTLLSAILLSVCIFFLGHPHRQQTDSASIQNPTTDAAQKKPALIRLYIVLFFFCLLAVLHVLPYPAVFVLVLLGAWVADKKSSGAGRLFPARHVSRIFYFHRKSRQDSRLCLLAFCSALRPGNPHQRPRLPGHEQRSGGAFAVRLFQ